MASHTRTHSLRFRQSTHPSAAPLHVFCLRAPIFMCVLQALQVPFVVLHRHIPRIPILMRIYSTPISHILMLWHTWYLSHTRSPLRTSDTPGTCRQHTHTSSPSHSHPFSCAYFRQSRYPSDAATAHTSVSHGAPISWAYFRHAKCPVEAV
jgi:hypothetical protein